MPLERINTSKIRQSYDEADRLYMTPENYSNTALTVGADCRRETRPLLDHIDKLQQYTLEQEKKIESLQDQAKSQQETIAKLQAKLDEQQHAQPRWTPKMM